MGLGGSGSGIYPTEDPWGKKFDSRYFPDRRDLGGKLIANGIRGIYDATQMDLEFVKKCYTLDSGLS